MDSITIEQLWAAGFSHTAHFTNEQVRHLPHFQIVWNGINIINPKLRQYHNGTFVARFSITDGRTFTVKLSPDHPVYDYVPGPFDPLSPVIDWGKLPTEFKHKDEYHMEVCIF